MAHISKRIFIKEVKAWRSSPQSSLIVILEDEEEVELEVGTGAAWGVEEEFEDWKELKRL